MHLKSNVNFSGEELENQRNIYKREYAARQILEKLRELTGRYGKSLTRAVVAGDFNTNEDDERFVRIHKRIREENAKRSIPPEKPVISQREVEIMEHLNRVKDMIDETIYYNVHVLGNPPVFNQDVLRAVSLKLNEMDIKASLDDRKFIQRQIAEEYLADYDQAG